MMLIDEKLFELYENHMSKVRKLIKELGENLPFYRLTNPRRDKTVYV